MVVEIVKFNGSMLSAQQSKKQDLYMQTSMPSPIFIK